MSSPLRPEEEASYREYCASRVRALRRAAVVLCGDWHDAESLVRDTLIKVYVEWRRVSSTDDVDAQVKRMLIDTFLDSRRRSRHMREAIADDLPEVPPDSPYSLEDQLDVRQALATLGASQRVILLLRFYGDLSVEETARVLRCSEGNVKSQTARGLAALQRAFTAGKEEQKP
jgi:RNA polymerase sigma-70 factor (sigma-E family)